MKKEGFNRNIDTRQNGIDTTETKEFFAGIVKNWYWFVLGGVLGTLAGIFFYSYSPDTYEVSSTVLVKAENKRGLAASFFEDQNLPGFHNTDVASQVGILKSYTLSMRAIQNLNWDISIYEDKLLNKKDRYLNEPFIVEKAAGKAQTEMVPVHIRPVSEDAFVIKVKAETQVNGRPVSVNLAQQVKYGEPFINKYFDFTIQKNKGSSLAMDQDYILVFNNLSELAHEYQKRLDISVDDEDSNLIYIALEGSQPLRDINYLNELTRVYIDFGLEEKNRVADNTLRFISNQLIGITDSLQSASKDFTNFRSRNKIVDLGQEANIVVSNLEELEGEEARINMKVEYYNNLKRYLNDASQMKELVAPSVVGITDPSLNTLVLKLSDLYSQKEVLSYTVQEKNPNLVSLVNEIQYTQRILGENIDNLLTNTYVEQASLNERKQKVNRQLARLPKTEQDLVNIKRTFDLNNDLYTFLLRKRAEVGIARASNAADAKILDTARLDAAVLVGPKKLQIILIGLLVGLGLPLAIILLADYFDNKIANIDEVEGKSLLPIAGTIASNKFKTELPVFQHPNSTVAESFRSLRTNLYYLINHTDKKIFAIHSAMMGEGKSFIAANLASILALNKKKVLLVEADMKKPRLHAIFKFSRENGLSNYLSGKVSFSEITLPTKTPGLSFVTAGPASLYSSELLSNGAFERFVKEARERFDFVVFDSVPTELLSDAIIIGQHADVNLVVLRMRYSKKTQIKSVNKLAEEGVMPGLSLVLNDVSSKFTKKQLKEYGYY